MKRPQIVGLWITSHWCNHSLPDRKKAKTSREHVQKQTFLRLLYSAFSPFLSLIHHFFTKSNQVYVALQASWRVFLVCLSTNVRKGRTQEVSWKLKGHDLKEGYKCCVLPEVVWLGICYPFTRDRECNQSCRFCLCSWENAFQMHVKHFIDVASQNLTPMHKKLPSRFENQSMLLFLIALAKRYLSALWMIRKLHIHSQVSRFTWRLTVSIFMHGVT